MKNEGSGRIDLKYGTGHIPVKETPKCKFTRRQIFTIISLSYGNLCLGTMYALLAPFFPLEAEKRGVSPTQYGLVFGVFEFGQFLFAPLIALIIPSISPKFFIVTGLFITAYCNCVFGLLEWSPPGNMYFGLAFVLRLVSSVGGTGYLTSCFTLVAIDFPDRVSTFFATTEMFFGLGMIIGPSLGGFLFELGGFSLPFFFASLMTFLASIFAFFCLESKPAKDEKKQVTQDEVPGHEVQKASVIKLLGNFSIFINIFINFTTFINIGFIDATLEHHIRDFTSLAPSTVGLIFMIAGLIYAISSQGFGIIIDKLHHCHVFCIFGYILSLLGFILAGPMYPLPLKPSISLIIVSQVLLGVSFGATIVACFTDGIQQVLKSGFPDDITTTCTMSALYQSSCALGATIGPILGGSLMDHFGYYKASISMVVLQATMIIVISAYGIYDKCSQSKTSKAAKSTVNA